jgi:DNA-binding FadR family transcriptional regulator
VADVLGLPLDQVDAVCNAVEAATASGVGAHRFVGMSYRRLRRACLAGDAAAARAWMERTAAGGGAGGA